jgi:hypothetical protein
MGHASVVNVGWVTDQIGLETVVVVIKRAKEHESSGPPL